LLRNKFTINTWTKGGVGTVKPSLRPRPRTVRTTFTLYGSSSDLFIIELCIYSRILSGQNVLLLNDVKNIFDTSCNQFFASVNVTRVDSWAHVSVTAFAKGGTCWSGDSIPPPNLIGRMWCISYLMLVNSNPIWHKAHLPSYLTITSLRRPVV